MDYTNFQVGDTFPIPIANQTDGGMFQADANGCMFILQLSHTDIIATEAFRTGKMELALYEEDGLLFLLYQIDGIFKAGWGDAPLALHTLKADQKPTKKSMADPAIHLYLVDTNLKVLLAMRTVEMNDTFHSTIKNYIRQQEKKPIPVAVYMSRLQKIWHEKSSAEMREKAAAVLEIPMDIPAKPVH